MPVSGGEQDNDMAQWRRMIAMRAVEAVEIDWAAASYPPDTGAIFERIAEAFDEPSQIALRDDGDVIYAYATGVFSAPIRPTGASR